jgi:geranylgeranyl diphosphate synthase type I
MDRADTRRGMPSIHRLFADSHRRERWAGDADRFGESAAILIGDLCLAWSDDMFAGSGLPAEALRAARAPYDAMRTEVMAGQYLDLLEQVRGTATVDGAMRVVRLKSAKYTVERPLHVGARLAGADDQLVDAYSAYGIPLGEAFQLRDDLLGVYGDPAVTGKPAGDDLREGKRTVLLATALFRATGAQRATLDRLVGDPDLDADGVDALRAVIRDVGALDEVERLIDELATTAHNALAAAPVTDEARDVLGELAVAATTRRT